MPTINNSEQIRIDYIHLLLNKFFAYPLKDGQLTEYHLDKLKTFKRVTMKLKDLTTWSNAHLIEHYMELNNPQTIDETLWMFDNDFVAEKFISLLKKDIIIDDSTTPSDLLNNNIIDTIIHLGEKTPKSYAKKQHIKEYS
jgi:hypothetical protein